MKYSSISPYMLKPTFLLTQGFDDNKKAQKNIFKHMCNFGAREEWMNGRKAISSYPGVETRNDQYYLFNTPHLEFFLLSTDLCVLMAFAY